MLTGSANDINITANFRPMTVKKPSNKQTLPRKRETIVEQSLNISSKVTVFMLEPEQQVEKIKL